MTFNVSYVEIGFNREEIVKLWNSLARKVEGAVKKCGEDALPSHSFEIDLLKRLDVVCGFSDGYTSELIKEWLKVHKK